MDTGEADIRFVGRTCPIGSRPVVQVRVVIDVLAPMNLTCFLVTRAPKAVATPMERAEMESIVGHYPGKLRKWWKLFCSLCLKGRKSLVIRLGVFEWIAKRLVLTAGVSLVVRHITYLAWIHCKSR